MQITERYNFRYQNVKYVNKLQCFSHWDKNEETGLVIRNEYPQRRAPTSSPSCLPPLLSFSQFLHLTGPARNPTPSCLPAPTPFAQLTLTHLTSPSLASFTRLN